MKRFATYNINENIISNNDLIQFLINNINDIKIEKEQNEKDWKKYYLILSDFFKFSFTIDFKDDIHSKKSKYYSLETSDTMDNDEIEIDEKSAKRFLDILLTKQIAQKELF